MFAVCDFFPFVLSVCRGKNKPAEEKLATGKKIRQAEARRTCQEKRKYYNEIKNLNNQMKTVSSREEHIFEPYSLWTLLGRPRNKTAAYESRGD